MTQLEPAHVIFLRAATRPRGFSTMSREDRLCTSVQNAARKLIALRAKKRLEVISPDGNVSAENMVTLARKGSRIRAWWATAAAEERRAACNNNL